MTEPQQVLVQQATEALRKAGRSLRERGWPMELIVDYLPENQSYAVSLRYELPAMPIPIEANRGE